MKTAAVLPAHGIGDALLMMIASHQLYLSGFEVTTYHDALPELRSWFPNQRIQPLPKDQEISHLLGHYDLIVAENDNSQKIQQLLKHCRSRLSLFYPTYLATKHAPLATACDCAFDKEVPMADNIAAALAHCIPSHTPSKDNGLTPPPSLLFRLKSRQVLIHPTSSTPAKNWKVTGFLSVARKLKKEGFDPLFCVGPKERPQWQYIEKLGFNLADLPTLADLAAIVYESGYVIGNDSLIGHLASNLGIPTLIIANDAQRMRLWRPGWLPGELVLPPPYLPNWRVLRLKEKRWQHFITPRQVLRCFLDLACV